jgi:hypothetical protein
MGNSLVSEGKRPVLLLGSVPFGSAREVFEAVGSSLGGFVRRIPDGETGPRWNWIVWQGDVIGATQGLETGGTREIPGVARRFELQRLKPGVAASELKLGPLGYSKAALDSYQTFVQLRASGKIPAGVRFQVSLPTPIAVVWSFFAREAVRPVWPVYEARLFQETDEIVRAIPHQDLAIQWDVAIEFACILEVPEEAKLYTKEELIRGMARCVDRVPADIEAGVHFCYGDPGHKHLVEPKDTALMVESGNGVTATSRRAITWLHMPVPRNRDADSTRILHRGLMVGEIGARELGQCRWSGFCRIAFGVLRADRSNVLKSIYLIVLYQHLRRVIHRDRLAVGAFGDRGSTIVVTSPVWTS